jgi:hypothetical protein
MNEMEQEHYRIDKHDRGWLVSAQRAPVLLCERKRSAINAVRLAKSHAPSTSRSGRDASADTRNTSEPLFHGCLQHLLMMQPGVTSR